MPLNGQVPGYRQQPGEIWIDGHRSGGGQERTTIANLSPSSAGIRLPDLSAAAAAAAAAIAAEPHEAAAAERRYGYMDDYKASMICSWVETQADAKFLTQFKQAVDSSDSGSEHQLGTTSAEVSVEVHTDHHHHQEASSFLPLSPLFGTGFGPVDEKPPVAQGIMMGKRGAPPQPPPRRSPCAAAPPLELCGTARAEGAASDDSMEPLPEPDFQALDVCRGLPGEEDLCY
jgi:hypothetical protein